jgi:hypothetical protein
MRCLASIGGCAILFAGSSAAALSPATATAGPVFWTVKQAKTALLSSRTRVDAAFAYGIETAAYTSTAGYASTVGAKLTGPVNCRGLGKARRSAYGGFLCSVQPQGVQRYWLWVRPWGPSFICASNWSLFACPPRLPAHPLPGDPRVCSSFNDPLSCIIETVRTATLDQLQGRMGAFSYFGCLAWAVFVYHCTWANGAAGGAAMVTFVPGKTSWKTVVAQICRVHGFHVVLCSPGNKQHAGG